MEDDQIGGTSYLGFVGISLPCLCCYLLGCASCSAVCEGVYFYTKSMFSRSTLSLIFVKICVYFTVQKDHGFGSHID